MEFSALDPNLAPTKLAWLSELRNSAFDWTVDKLQIVTAVEYFVTDDAHMNVAFVAFRRLPDAIEIVALATRPGMEGRGIMTATIKAFLSSLQRAKTSQPEVWLEVHAANERALKLYMKLGFRETGRRPKYYKDGGTAILMTMALNSA